MDKKVVYIAGLYRDSRGEWFIMQNILNAEETALWVWQHHGIALCPHKNTAFFGGSAPDETWMDGDLVLLSRCDAVLMVQGWEKSAGARKERQFAIDNDIPVFYDYQEITRYLEE